jgi:NodT family efflux transporter outer membrane factor (OMF) lipoprotein
MMSFRALTTICAALVAGGCTLAPRPLTPVVSLPSPMTSTPDSSLTVLPQIVWNDIQRDPVVAEMIAAALQENRDLRVAVLRVEQARQQYRIRTGALLPAVDASTSVSWTEARGRNGTALSGSVDLLSWEVDLFGRLRSQRTQAGETFLATADAQRATRLSLIASVATQYYAILRADAQRRLAEETYRVVEDLLALTRALVNAGATSELDLRTAEAQAQSARISALNFAREGVLARNALDVLVGRPVLRSVRPDSQPWVVAARPAAVPAALPSQLLLRRPDISQAEHNLFAANADVGAARAAFFPRIVLTGSAGSSSDALGSLFTAGTGLWSFVPRISVPLFRGGQNRAALASAEAGAKIAVAQYEQTIQVAFREAADAITSVGNYADVLAQQQQLIESQRKRLELATLRYRSGEDAYLPVLTAQQDYLSAQQSYIDTNFNYIASRLQLSKALGGEP